MLDRGLELVHQRGFNATGVQDIADAAGIPKGSFYNYFSSKEDFGIAVLNRYVDVACDYLDRKLIRSPQSPRDRLRAVFDEWTEFTERHDCSLGCLIGNLSLEMSASSPALRVALDGAFRRVESYFVACLREAQGAGELAAEADPDKLACFVYSAWQGALLRAKAGRSTAPLRQFQQIVLDRVLV